MKHCRPLDCCCCCWLTLLLVASSIIYVSPESSTTATVKFNRQQQNQQSQQPQHSESSSPFKYIATSAATTMTYNNNKYNKNQSISNIKDKHNVTETTIAAETRNSVPRIELTTITMELTREVATVAAAAATRTVAITETTLPTTSTTIPITRTTTRNPYTNTKLTIANNSSTTKQESSISNKLNGNSESDSEELMMPIGTALQRQQLVHDSMFFSMEGRSKVIPSKLHENHHRYTRQAEEEDPDNRQQINKCHKFLEGDDKKNELYSPDFPNLYPKNINCTRVLEAPKGQIIRLDFRDNFHIEYKEQCKFDFLEIRDGKYGFSNLIGKYCGTDFPPEIISTERYLWLHFHSDESIEYSGFTAVYEFIERKGATSKELNCTIYKDGHSGTASSSVDIPDSVWEAVRKDNIPLDCMWRIEVQEGWKIQVKFEDFKLINPNDCEMNFLDFFPENPTIPSRIKNFCGSAGEPVQVESNVLHLHFFAEQKSINSKFSIIYTAYRERPSTGCTDDEYDCSDETCIDISLKCDGHPNCKFLWDEAEDMCKTEQAETSEHIKIIIIIFGLILGGMVVTSLVNCVRKIMRDQKIIREHVRQSKESKLDEMGRNSKARSQTNLSMAMSPRQKHSQTSLQILDDVYYREVVPISVQTGGGNGKVDLKEKEHSILRHHHDMTVQTSLALNDSSSTTSAATNDAPLPPPPGGDPNVCDMGCQTRESLFAPALMRQKSISPMGASGSLPPPPRFSTFGYDMQQPPPPPPPAISTLARHSIRVPAESIELEERPQQQQHGGATHQHHQHQHQHQSSAGSGTMRPQEICHHHHQHQQHLQQQQQQQQQQKLQQQQKYQPQQQQQQQYVPTTMQRTMHKQQQQQQQQQQPKQHQSTATIIPATFLPTSVAAAATAATIGTKNNSKHQKVDGSNSSYNDIRNSAPDVIIMTSH